MTCPRCGREQPPGHSGRSCVHCGRVLTGVRWVATTPEALRPRAVTPARRPYSGPPRYRTIPRWSLWPWAAPPAPPGPERGDAGTRPGVELRSAASPARLRASAEFLRRLAVTTALLAGVAAAGEVFRYVLLVRSRDRALPAALLGWSDALVTLFGLLAPTAALATGVVFLRWLVTARAIAADFSGTRPARTDRAVVVGSILPPLTLAVPGAALAEVEHAAAGRPPDARPTPSRPVVVWWALWALGVLLALGAIASGFRTSTQALADGVLLRAVVDVVAVATALATARVVGYLTELVAPVLRPSGRSYVVRPVG